MSSENSENAAQLVPNWNSSGMPVTTPITKVTAKILAQNRVDLLYSSFRLRMKALFKTKISSASPMVSVEKR